MGFNLAFRGLKTLAFFSTDFGKKIQISIFMNIRPVGAELLCGGTDRQTDGQTDRQTDR